MNGRTMRILTVLFSGFLLLILLFVLVPLASVRAQTGDTLAPAAPASPDTGAAWTIDTLADFVQGTPNNVALHAPGSATLDWNWWLDGRVNELSTDSKFSPRTAWIISPTGTVTDTTWLAVWADERQADHSPDIFLARSNNHGRTWSPNVLIDDACDPDDPPYPDCPAHYSPDITARALDNSLWVVWQQAEPGSGADTGNLYYATSGDLGSTWPVTGTITVAAGKQHSPRIAATRTTLYTIWESERTDDGDIEIARYNPTTDSAWSAPIAVSDDSSGKEQRNPALAADAAGNLYAVWTDFRADDDGQIYFSRWLSGTTWADGSWSAAVRLSDASADWGTDPDIKASPDGSIYAAWVERVPTGPATYDFQVVVARSTDQGDSWSTAVVHRLTSASAGNAFYQGPSLGVMFPGRIAVAWLHSPDSQAATASILTAASFDRGTHWSIPKRVNTTPTVDVDSLPSLAMNLAGHAVVAWQDFRLGSSTNIFATGYPADRYALTGDYLATRQFNGPAVWDTLTWTATVPGSTSLSVLSRVYVDTTTGWTDWITHTTSPVSLTHPAGEAIQIKAAFTSPGVNTPELEAIELTYEESVYLYLPVMLKN